MKGFAALFHREKKEMNLSPICGRTGGILLCLLLAVSVCAPAAVPVQAAAAETETAVVTENSSESEAASETGAGSGEETGTSDSGYQLYIDDSADLLTSEEEEMLASQMSQLLTYGNMMFTTVTLSDNDYVSYAENTYYEQFGNEPGVHLQIDMGNRKLTLSCSTDMEAELGSERESIVDNIYTYASDGDYLGCASECFREIDSVLNDVRISHKMKHINNAIVALILGLLLNFLAAFVSVRGKNAEKKRKKAAVTDIVLDSVQIRKGALTKIYDPRSSDSSSSGGSGGGGGGGFSGGSSSHGF